MQAMLRGAFVGAVAMCAGPAFAIDSFFDVFTELSIGQPPTPPVGMHAGRVVGGAFQSDLDMKFMITSAQLSGAAPAQPVELRLQDAGGPPGAFGLYSFFDVFFGDLDTAPAPSSFFDVFVDLDPAPGMATPKLRSAPHAQFVDSFFDVFVEIDIGGGLWHEIHMEGQIAPGGRFRNVVPGGSTFDSFFDVFVEIDLPQTNGPALSTIMTGRVMPAPGAAVLLGMGGVLATRRRRR